MKFDPTKPVKTRDGREVRILASDLPGPWPIAAAIKLNDDDYALYSYPVDGHYYSDGRVRNNDLVNVPEEREVWINVHVDGHGKFYLFSHDSKESAASVKDKFAMVKVKFFEGQFDD